MTDRRSVVNLCAAVFAFSAGALLLAGCGIRCAARADWLGVLACGLAAAVCGTCAFVTLTGWREGS